MSDIATFRRFGFVVLPQFFDAAALAKEIDQVMKRAFRSQHVTNGIKIPNCR